MFMLKASGKGVDVLDCKNCDDTDNFIFNLEFYKSIKFTLIE